MKAVSRRDARDDHRPRKQSDVRLEKAQQRRSRYVMMENLLPPYTHKVEKLKCVEIKRVKTW